MELKSVNGERLCFCCLVQNGICGGEGLCFDLLSGKTRYICRKIQNVTGHILCHEVTSLNQVIDGFHMWSSDFTDISLTFPRADLSSCCDSLFVLHL